MDVIVQDKAIHVGQWIFEIFEDFSTFDVRFFCTSIYVSIKYKNKIRKRILTKEHKRNRQPVTRIHKAMVFLYKNTKRNVKELVLNNNSKK